MSPASPVWRYHVNTLLISLRFHLAESIRAQAMEDLVSLVYFSHACRRFDDAALLGLLRIARENNARDDVTGMLLYDDGNFIQALEGPRATVERTFARIAKNPEHAGIMTTRVIPIAQRQFGDWSMGFLTSSALSAEARASINDFLRSGHSDAIPSSFAWSMLATFRNNAARAA